MSMSQQQVEILFICGSPRARTSETLLALLEQGVQDAGARSRKFLLSQKHIAPCIGCGSCEKTGECILTKENSKLYAHDDYIELTEALASADALAVVSPLFFSGPPAQLKALFDRMQPFWSRKYLLGQPQRPKRPAQLFMLGGGGDPHGHEPLVTIARGSLAVAGFTLEKVQNFVGFKYPSSVPSLPSDEEAAQMSFKELSRLRKASIMQQDFVERAVTAGGALARFASRSKAKLEVEITASFSLPLIEADSDSSEAAASLETNTGNSEASSSSDPATGTASVVVGDSSVVLESEHGSVKIVNQVDMDFEVLKQSARAAKLSKPNQIKLAAAIEEAVSVITEHGSKLDDESDWDNLFSVNADGALNTAPADTSNTGSDNTASSDTTDTSQDT